MVMFVGFVCFFECDDGFDLCEMCFVIVIESVCFEVVVRDFFMLMVLWFVIVLIVVYLYLNIGVYDIVLLVVVMVCMLVCECCMLVQCVNMLLLCLYVELGYMFDDLCCQVNCEMIVLCQYQCYWMGDLYCELMLFDNGQGVFGFEINIMVFDYDLWFGDCVMMLYNLFVGIIDDLMVNLIDCCNGELLCFDFDVSLQYYSCDVLNVYVGQFLIFMCVVFDELFVMFGVFESWFDF